MLNLDQPTLDANGNLKEPWELEFINSPSDETVPLSPIDTADDPVPLIDSGKKSGVGLKGKEPARCVGTKHVSKPSVKVAEARGQQLSPKTQRFFSSRFEGPSPFFICSFFNLDNS